LHREESEKYSFLNKKSFTHGEIRKLQKQAKQQKQEYEEQITKQKSLTNEQINQFGSVLQAFKFKLSRKLRFKKKPLVQHYVEGGVGKEQDVVKKNESENNAAQPKNLSHKYSIDNLNSLNSGELNNIVVKQDTNNNQSQTPLAPKQFPYHKRKQLNLIKNQKEKQNKGQEQGRENQQEKILNESNNTSLTFSKTISTTSSKANNKAPQNQSYTLLTSIEIQLAENQSSQQQFSRLEIITVSDLENNLSQINMNSSFWEDIPLTESVYQQTPHTIKQSSITVGEVKQNDENRQTFGAEKNGDKKEQTFGKGCKAVGLGWQKNNSPPPCKRNK